MKRIIVLILIFIGIAVIASADHLIKAEKALEKIFPDATSFEEHYLTLTDEQTAQIEQSARINFDGVHSKKMIVYSVKVNGQHLGQAFEDTVVGKWGPIHYLAGLDPNGTILRVMVLDYDEVRGKPVAKKRFLRQYKGKNINNKLRLRRDIDGVTGATISSRSLTDGIRKIVHINNIIDENQLVKEMEE